MQTDTGSKGRVVGTAEPRVALVQAALGQYRTDFISEIRRYFGARLTVACGDRSFDGTATAIPADFVDVRLTNVYLFGNRCLFQKGVTRLIRHNDTLVMELNPRVLSVWLAVFVKRILGKRVVLWGHYNGRTLGETQPRLARRALAAMSDAIVAYTELDVEKFKTLLPSKSVYLAANAIERRSSIAVASEEPRNAFVYSGRLMPAKKVDVLLRAFQRENELAGAASSSKLIIVGDGPSRASLESLAQELGIAHRTFFTGEVFGSAKLDSIYETAVAGVCAGYVGLNITQSLSRGVPFIYCQEANHSPEVSIAIGGFNSFLAKSPAPEAFADAMRRALFESNEGFVRNSEIQNQTLATYSVEAMADGFIAAAELRI